MYNGLEVFWQYVGHGDCLLLRRWENDKARVVLIDGGLKNQYETRLKPLLEDLGIEHIDAILNTHPDQDHIGGLIKVVEDSDFTVGEGWMHRPSQHRGSQGLSTLLKMTAVQFSTNEARYVVASMRDSDDLEDLLLQRGIPIIEPFQGETVQGFLSVWGPTVEHYESLVPNFTEPTRVEAISSALSIHKAADTFAALQMGKAKGLEENPQTSPENDSSAVTFTSFDDTTFLFTGDVGAPGLTQALDYGGRSGFNWMHAPHHGSRHNITAKLLDRTKPKRLVYSSEPDFSSHPHVAVRQAVKERRITEYGTWHKKTGAKRATAGRVPQWSGSEGWEALG